MALRTDAFDLGQLHLATGEARRLELHVVIDPLELGGERYSATPALVPARLEISRMTGQGYALRLRFEAALSGPCTRCLEPARPVFSLDAREVSQPGEGQELESPYVQRAVLDLHGWACDVLALALPTKILCRADCAGLCPVCGANINRTGPDHGHEREPDLRWAKLSELEFD